MNYNGIEIDMLSLGNADSILVTLWDKGNAERVLIDGGDKSSASTVRSFLRKQGISYIDHVVCSHYHDDHAAGLVELFKDESLQVGRLWVHHSDIASTVRKVGSFLRYNEARVITESLKTQQFLVALANARGIPISEPFTGERIGGLTVCGPSPEFYKDMVSQLADESYYSDKSVKAAQLLERIEEMVAESSNSLMDNPRTEPINETSTILAANFDEEIYVFTADAGAQALAAALNAYKIAPCKWMQIPHHGSHRNITRGLIEMFSPTTAFVSAEGSQKHPRQAVVNAFKKAGTKVYSTHYPNGRDLYHHSETVPERAGYITATPLWESKE